MIIKEQMQVNPIRNGLFGTGVALGRGRGGGVFPPRLATRVLVVAPITFMTQQKTQGLE